MAIRSIKKGKIKCDACHKQIATVRASAEVFAAFETEARFTEVRCMECSEKPVTPLKGTKLEKVY